MRTVILLQIIVSLALVTEQASMREKEMPRSGLPITPQDDDDGFPDSLTDILSSFRTSRKRTESTDITQKLWELTDFPFKDKISGPCLASILSQICHKVFPGLGESEFPAYDTTRADEDEFSCSASECQIQKLQARYCGRRQQDFSTSGTSNGGESTHSHSSNNNVDPGCARYITEETYKEVRREGWRCERDLRCICRDCVPIPKGKHHHHYHHYHHNRQGSNLSPLARVLLADLHRSQMPVAKKEVLAKLLQESVNELIPKHHMFQNSSAVRVTNPERNFPLQG